jgi:hypothetical protein
MFVIRREQLRAMRPDRAELHTWIAQHLREHFAEQTEEMDDDSLLAFAAEGDGRAFEYGIEDAVAVCKFVDLMILLGKDFDTNPAYPWAAAILKDSSMSPSDRIDAVTRTASSLQAKTT